MTTYTLGITAIPKNAEWIKQRLESGDIIQIQSRGEVIAVLNKYNDTNYSATQPKNTEEEDTENRPTRKKVPKTKNLKESAPRWDGSGLKKGASLDDYKAFLLHRDGVVHPEYLVRMQYEGLIRRFPHFNLQPLPPEEGPEDENPNEDLPISS